MVQMSRRRALGFGLFSAAALLTGCGGSELVPGATGSVPGDAPPPPTPAPVPTPAPTPTPAPVWDPSPWLTFTSGAGPASVDLNVTLPAGVVRGGVFGLAPGSSPLPQGIVLSSAGVLTAASPSAGVTQGVMFSYAEPGS